MNAGLIIAVIILLITYPEILQYRFDLMLHIKERIGLPDEIPNKVLFFFIGFILMASINDIAKKYLDIKRIRFIQYLISVIIMTVIFLL